uniref:Uncharacterized protein n=1 Tax=Lepeophtheirus salmonis TaxID=72036 RepID=A0A0K2TAF0_LEPSM
MEHYILGEFTPILETRRLTLTILFNISTWLKKLSFYQSMAMGSNLLIIQPNDIVFGNPSHLFMKNVRLPRKISLFVS